MADEAAHAGADFAQLGEINEGTCACVALLVRSSGVENTLQAAGILARLGEAEMAELTVCDTRSAALELARKCKLSVDLGMGAVAAPGSKPCKAEVAAWPIYVYWQQRLRIEIALARKQFNAAANLSTRVPLEAAFDTVPDYLLRLGQTEMAALKATLSKTPGRWWFEPERNPPGILAALRA